MLFLPLPYPKSDRTQHVPTYPLAASPVGLGAVLIQQQFNNAAGQSLGREKILVFVPACVLKSAWRFNVPQ